MFQDTLIIIKPDYLHKRRPLLLKLLSAGFQIQGNRRLNFSPELAAEFYADYADEKGFMLEVILLSKGISEAFIVTKENAVHELLNIMICYFGSSSELERNVHVTKHPDSVAREITFIFPNYIHEPIPVFDGCRFTNRPMLKPLLSEIYDILQNVDCSQLDWKTRVADYLVRSNPSVPQISNQCQLTPDLSMQEKAQQTTMTYKSPDKGAKPKDKSVSTSSVLSSTSPHSSMLLTTSSCVTCGGFEHTEPCISELDLNKRVEPQSDEPICVEEEIIWKEIVVYEEVVPEEESGHDSEKTLDVEGEHVQFRSSVSGDEVEIFQDTHPAEKESDEDDSDAKAEPAQATSTATSEPQLASTPATQSAPQSAAEPASEPAAAPAAEPAPEPAPASAADDATSGLETAATEDA